MAKSKGEETVTIDPNIENPDGSLKTMKQKAEEARLVQEANDRAKKFEDVLAEVQPLLHRFRKLLPQSQAAADANIIYMQVRGVLGDRGNEIDRVMRGG